MKCLSPIPIATCTCSNCCDTIIYLQLHTHTHTQVDIEACISTGRNTQALTFTTAVCLVYV